MTEVLYLESEDVATLAGMADYVPAIRDGFRQRGEGATADNRTVIPSDTGSPASIISYGATLPDTGVMGRYSFVPSSKTRGWFLTTLFDTETGEPLALIDGAVWNPMKTGAVGAVAIDELARDDASTMGIVGSGTQAAAQLEAAKEVRDLDAVDVFSPTRENREAFADLMNPRTSADVTAVASGSAAVSDADIVVTATNATSPVVDSRDIADGTHINAVGQGEPDKREIDAATVERAKYVPDHRDRALAKAGSFLMAIDEGAITEEHLYAELGEVVAGTVPGRERDDDVTLFDSSGTGVEVIAGAHMLYTKAREAGRGRTVSLAPADSAFDLLPFVR